MKPITFSSSINVSEIDFVEKLLYFNDNQHKYMDDIETSITSYGEPRIIVENNRLAIIIANIEPQTLFVSIENEHIGLVIFNRDTIENIDIVHIALHEDFQSGVVYGDEMLVPRILNHLVSLAKHLKGVKTITVKYKPSSVLQI